MLTEMTQGVGIAAAIPQASPALDRMELVALPDRRVLMVVMTRDHQVRNRVVDAGRGGSRRMSLRRSATTSTATSRAGRWRTCAGNWPRAWTMPSATYDVLLQKLTVLYSKGLLDLGSVPEVHMDGASNLVGLDLHLTKEKMRELFRALEEKKRVLELLDRFLEQPAGEIGVHVGLGEMHPSMRELSLIGLPVMLPNGMSAVIAVLGPMRMNYGRVMSAVQHVGQAFQSA